MAITTRARRALIAASVIGLATVIGGCAIYGSTQTRAVSSVYDYLYPEKDGVIEEPGIPVLRPPVKVGIAFVPETGNRGGYGYWSGDSIRAGFTEQKKLAVLQRVADHFRKDPIVGSIEVIPAFYLKPGGSFANLRQLKSMYGIDLIALVSYDQVQFSDEDALSFSYWTIVGAYVIAGEKNSTETMVDTVVYDIESKKMLFRAPGMSTIKGRATPVNLSEELRTDGARGLDLASDQMILMLDKQLIAFRERVKENPAEYKVEQRAGYSGGGAAGVEWLALLFTVLLWRLYAGRRREPRGHHFKLPKDWR